MYRIETINAEYALAEVVGERAGMIGVKFSTVKDRNARKQLPYDGGIPVVKVDWVPREEIVRMVAVD